jgi:hypothetical protein
MFYKNSFNKIKKSRPKIKEASIENYLRNIKKISNELFCCDNPNINYFCDYESIKEYLESIKNLSSRKNMCTSIIVLLTSSEDSISKKKDIIKSYKKYQAELALKQDDIYIENTKSNKEEENWVSREDILNLIESIKQEIITKGVEGFKKKRNYVDKYQQYLVLSLYYYLPPVRNDYVDAKVVNDEFLEKNIDKNFNYINLFDNTLYLCNYKTSKFYGVQKIAVPASIIEIINEYTTIKKDFLNYDGDFLLISTTNNTQMKTNTLTKYLNKIFQPKKVSTTILRKVYLSEKYPIMHSIREAEDDARIMGHNLNVARRIYTKKLA